MKTKQPEQKYQPITAEIKEREGKFIVSVTHYNNDELIGTIDTFSTFEQAESHAEAQIKIILTTKNK